MPVGKIREQFDVQSLDSLPSSEANPYSGVLTLFLEPRLPMYCNSRSSVLKEMFYTVLYLFIIPVMTNSALFSHCFIRVIMLILSTCLNRSIPALSPVCPPASANHSLPPVPWTAQCASGTLRPSMFSFVKETRCCVLLLFFIISHSKL